jgi:GTP cyclohydrolase I
MIQNVIKTMGDDPARDGLKDTPRRVLKAWAELFSGYDEERRLDEILTVFDNDGKYDQMIVVDNLEFTSFCEHHLLPFHGVAHVGYVPTANGKILGLSKMGRVLDVYAKRLQNQERLTQQVAKCLKEKLAPAGVMCVLKARHSCMSCRGVRKQQASMNTSAVYGCFREEIEARQEFFNLIRGK